MSEWRKSRRSHANGNCVEVAGLPGGRVGVRDSKNPGGGHLAVTADALAAAGRGRPWEDRAVSDEIQQGEAGRVELSEKQLKRLLGLLGVADADEFATFWIALNATRNDAWVYCPVLAPSGDQNTPPATDSLSRPS